MKNPLNPDAGYVDFPADTGEIRAVLRAANISFRASPYYRLRWGERGRRFAFSDSGWLATLMGHSEGVATKQALWLGRVLANRGMPTYLLARHLSVLHTQLAREGARAEELSRLDAARQALLARRHAVLSDGELSAWSHRFATLSDQRPHALLSHVGLLLTAAHADRVGGMKNAVSSVTDWMMDEERWPAHWIDGCDAFLAALEEAYPAPDAAEA